MIIFFWTTFFIVFYTFAGYALVLFFLVKIKGLLFGKSKHLYDINDLPSVTLIVAAYNEAGIIEAKIKDTLALNYPSNKIRIIFVTDGSTDGTPEKVMLYPAIKLLHEAERKGKINAMHRAMQQVTTAVTVFTDANTFLNKDALINIARHYDNKKVGAVSGEKRVHIEGVADATAGEGFYWRYESLLKKWDSELYSVVGAAGELFSIRTSLYKPVKQDTILDDFMISLLIASDGYRIVYEPHAFATETTSANTKEELKRKVRIAAGGIQSILRLKPLLNPFKYPVLSFQYISHRVLRWTVTPFCMILVLLINVLIVAEHGSLIYQLLLMAQLLFYFAAGAGWFFERKEIKIKPLFVPYYFCLMNVAVLMGMGKFIAGKQSAVWEKAERK